MNAIAYCRLSPGERKTAGRGNHDAYGLDAQRDAIKVFAARERLRILDWYDDIDVSGGDALDDRPALMAALARLGPGDVLIVHKRDRLARDVLYDAMITRLAEGSGARILAADGAGNGDDPASEAMRGMLAVFAQFERALVAARTRAALAAKRARGECVGSVPLGYRRIGNSLAPDEHEQQAIARAMVLRRAGTGYRVISHQLAAEGYRSRSGKPYHDQQVARLLRAGFREE